MPAQVRLHVAIGSDHPLNGFGGHSRLLMDRRCGDQPFDVDEVRKGRKPDTQVFSVRDGTCGVPTLVLEPSAAAASASGE